MPISGRKPKPRDQIRHRVPPVHEWHEYPDVSRLDGPPLPPRRGRAKPAEPGRPLGATGRALWEDLVPTALDNADRARLLVLCEAEDERTALRYRVLRDGAPDERHDLRILDAQVFSAYNGWCERHTALTSTWPRETRAWWLGVSALPHTVDWYEADWRYAADTAHIHAAVMVGEWRLEPALRAREKVIGTTADARRDLRIRYVPPAPEVETPASVTTMDAYRRALEPS